MSAPISFDNTGMPYDPSAVIQNGNFSIDMYKSYSPLFIPVTFAIAYGVAFASFTAVIVHTYCMSSLIPHQFDFTLLEIF